MKKALVCALPLVVATNSLVNGQVEVSSRGTRLAVAVRTERPPRMDGTLDDPVWKTAPVLDDFRQREPFETQAATEKSEVRILYDYRHIYFGIHCYDEPSGIIATQLLRDLSQDLDDNFAILIDPTASRRNGYIFQINPLGTQRDGEVIEEQAPTTTDSIVDPNWDGLWSSATKIAGDGWTATIAIPFSTLNFHGGGHDVSWGLNFRRFIRRKNEEDEWSGFRRVFGFWRVSQAGTLEGLTKIESGRLLVIKPYALGGAQAFQGQPWSGLHTGGVDIKYGLTSNLVALGTVNTDFSDADVDQQQFNLTPYPIFIPEKRRFFLEDSDVFNFLLWNQDLFFFSRQIGIDPVSGQQVPIDAGGKIAGHEAGFDVGVMDVRTRAEGTNPYANYAIVRVKRPLMPGSYVGFIATDKESGSATDPYNHGFGVDAKFLLFQNLNLRGYYAKTWTQGLYGDSAAFGARLTYANNWFNVYAGHGVTGRNFNAEMGFVTRTDDLPTIATLTFTPRPKIRGVREVDLGGVFFDDPNTADKLIYREWSPSLQVFFNNGAIASAYPQDVIYQVLTQPLHLYGNISVPVGAYRFASHQFGYTSAGNRRITYTGQLQSGQYYTGNLTAGTLTAQYRPSAHLTLAVNDTLNAFRLPQGNFDIELAGMQVSYAFNRSLNLATFVQANTSDVQAVSANVRLRYTFRPDSDLYVIYNAGTVFQAIAAGNPALLREQKVAVKVTYSWSK
ncbi:MAG: DUF5916 domain-containing protein [Terriglobales bacterium]